MSDLDNDPTPSIEQDYIRETARIVQRFNEILQGYSDNDWNYSRIRLKGVEVASVQSPYLLAYELVDPSTAKGRRDLKAVQDEVTWGDHHASELGILEIISLRVNKAMLALEGEHFSLPDAPQRRYRAVLRVVPRNALLASNIAAAIWYEVEEVAGEEFENR
jgi:hypothetical protein